MRYQYDDVAVKYQEAISDPEEDALGSLLGEPTFVRLLGTLGGGIFDVADLGCGEGRSTRLIRERTRGRVMGADISREMIRLARDKEEKAATGIEYMVVNCCQPMDMEGSKFDLVTAHFLLNYCATFEMLQASCANAFALLKPGGCFMGSTRHPGANRLSHFENARKFTRTAVSTGDKVELHDADAIYFTVGGHVLTTFYWGREAYERVFRDAGFTDLAWVEWDLAEGASQEERARWKGWMERPTVCCFVARKPVAC